MASSHPVITTWWQRPTRRERFHRRLVRLSTRRPGWDRSQSRTDHHEGGQCADREPRVADRGGRRIRCSSNSRSWPAAGRRERSAGDAHPRCRCGRVWHQLVRASAGRPGPRRAEPACPTPQSYWTTVAEAVLRPPRTTVWRASRQVADRASPPPRRRDACRPDPGGEPGRYRRIRAGRGERDVGKDQPSGVYRPCGRPGVALRPHPPPGGGTNRSAPACADYRSNVSSPAQGPSAAPLRSAEDRAARVKESASVPRDNGVELLVGPHCALAAVLSAASRSRHIGAGVADDAHHRAWDRAARWAASRAERRCVGFGSGRGSGLGSRWLSRPICRHALQTGPGARTPRRAVSDRSSVRAPPTRRQHSDRSGR